MGQCGDCDYYNEEKESCHAMPPKIFRRIDPEEYDDFDQFRPIVNPDDGKCMLYSKDYNALIKKLRYGGSGVFVVFECDVISKRSMSFKCPLCEQKNIHGISEEISHRVSHCDCWDYGYFVKAKKY